MFTLFTAVESGGGINFGLTILPLLVLFVYLIIFILAVSIPILLYKNYKVNRELLELKRRELNNRLHNFKEE